MRLTPPVTASWWESFFDDDYLHLWDLMGAGGDADAQVAALWTLLELRPGVLVLDAPCGYGRVSRLLAERGARVTGLDLSESLLGEAERRRGNLPPSRLAYRRHDLREPVNAADGAFDAAVNLFTALGYGTSEDDLRMLANLRAAVRPGGVVFVESAHRDYVASRPRGPRAPRRLSDGTLMDEAPTLDPLTGRLESMRRWYGPSGFGSKRSSVRIYTATEMLGLVEAAGLEVISTHAGCSAEPFVGADGAGAKRLGILARRRAR